ncbi:hypothetical protein DL93DRAFT_2164358 [Clavulina sp. PMI_390]|nr:hypothetical protein DL93DRAFT_2164358 [Clavulina sp. PMI_390]
MAFLAADDTSGSGDVEALSPTPHIGHDGQRETQAQTSPFSFDHLSATTKATCNEIAEQASHQRASIEAELSGLRSASSAPSEFIGNIPSTFELDSVIQQLKVLRPALQKIEDLKRTLAARKHNMNLTIFRLPKEIILEILELGVPIPGNAWRSETSPWPVNKDPAWQDWTIKEYHPFRAAVESTCALFRSLILSSAKAWSALYIPLSDPRIPPHILEAQLQRSSRIPLHLFVEYASNSGLTLYLPTYHAVLKPHLSRCHSIGAKNRVNKISLFRHLFDVENLANLRNFTFTFGDEGDKNDFGITNVNSLWSPAGPNDLDTAQSVRPLQLPALQTLSLRDNFSRSDSNPHALLSYELFAPSLTRLQLSGPFGAISVINFLSQCTVLEHFEWRSSFAGDVHNHQQSILQIPHLKSLCLVGVNSTLTLPPLNAPQLEEVVIGISDSRDGENTDPIDSSIFHSLQPHLPSLKRVKFDPYMIGVESIDDFLTKHRHIQEVVLDHYCPTYLGDDFLPLTETLTILGKPPTSEHCKDHTPHQTSRLKRLMLNLNNLEESNDSFLGHVVTALTELHDALPDVEIFATCNRVRPQVMLPFINLVSEGGPGIDDAWPSPWTFCEYTSDEGRGESEEDD